jgi:(p)ppGpp synthase/HD superfamily hydrolase
MTVLGPRFEEALIYALHLHAAQVRKGTAIPYASHLLSVAALALEAGATEDQAIAALLHDAVEDCGGRRQLEQIRRRFGDAVAAIVSDCTDAEITPKPPWRERKEAYIAALERKPRDSLLVSLADKTHNAEAIVEDLRELGDALWSRFTGGREGSLWYYSALAAAFERLVPGRGAARLSRAVRQMHELAGAGAEPIEAQPVPGPASPPQR